jgi:hypothetical protein
MKKKAILWSTQIISQHKLTVLMFALMLLLVDCIEMEPAIESNKEQVGIAAEGRTATTSPTMAILTKTVAPSPTSTALPSTIQEPTESITVTPTWSATPTNIPTIAPSLTPFPALSPVQRGELYDELMTTNNGCQLPCWWGLELGKSSLEEVIQLYTQFDPFITIQDYSDGYSVIEIKFVEPTIEEGIQTRHMLTILNGMLVEAEIQVRKYENFTPLSLMEEFGQPSEIWLWTIPEPFEGVLPADFLIYFPDDGILTGYRELANNIGGKVEICLNGDGGSTLLLWSPTIWDLFREKGFAERANASSELTLEGHKPIREVSNWDEIALYTNVIDPNSTECLETPSNLWTSP